MDDTDQQIKREPTLYCRVLKPHLEAVVAGIGLLLLSPLLLLCAILIKLDSRGPVLFKQMRTGQHGRPFKILKFRTMTHSAGTAGPQVTVAGDTRITKVGRWLRRSKIDELPQLVNILRGEMSFVGPRPEVPKYTAFYDARQRRVLSVKPGITGPASLVFATEEKLLANQADTEHFYVSRLMPIKLEMDISYCEKAGFLADIKLILQTMLRLLRA